MRCAAPALHLWPLGRRAGRWSRRTMDCRSACSHKLVDAALRGQSGVDVAVPIDADAVDVAALHAGEHISLSIANADIGGLAVVLLLGDVEIAVRAAADFVGSPHAGPLAGEVAVGGGDLDTPVCPVRAVRA